MKTNSKSLIKHLLTSLIAIVLITTSAGVRPVKAAGDFYTLKIINGHITGSDKNEYSAEAGSPVFITANIASEGKVFDTWKTAETLNILNVKGVTTTVIMPEKNATITATYKEMSPEAKAVAANLAITAARVLLEANGVDLAEGRDNNLLIFLSQLEGMRDLGVTLTMGGRADVINNYIAADGSITYGESEGSGYVGIKINKDYGSEQQAQVMVIVPAKSPVTRFGGLNREGTAILVSQEVYSKADSVVLAGLGGDVDALTGTLLAAKLDAPLLISRKDEIKAETVDEIKRLKAKTIYLLGGENVISKKVENQIQTLGLKFERIAGANRYDTAAKIADKVKSPDIGMPTSAFIVLGKEAKKGDALADALAVGPVSAMYNIPVLLVRQDEIPKETLAIIKKINVQEITIIGGNAAVSKKVENQLKEQVAYINRIAGNTREETAIEIAKAYFNLTDTAIMAYGRKSADALVGGYYGGKLKVPILLTNDQGLTKETKVYIENNIKYAKVLGGEAVISAKTYKEINNLLIR